MSSKLYVGNLAYSVNDQSLEASFSRFGTVQSAKVIVDRDTNRSKGFGFVEMSSPEEAEAAIASLDGQEIDGRAVRVNIAKPQEPRDFNRGPRGPRGPRDGGGAGGGSGRRDSRGPRSDSGRW